jgi:hypothetical protein
MTPTHARCRLQKAALARAKSGAAYAKRTLLLVGLLTTGIGLAALSSLDFGLDFGDALLHLLRLRFQGSDSGRLTAGLRSLRTRQRRKWKAVAEAGRGRGSRRQCESGCDGRTDTARD